MRSPVRVATAGVKCAVFCISSQSGWLCMAESKTGRHRQLVAELRNHRFPSEIISHAFWLYVRFSLSYHDVEELLFARGIVVTYEAIRKWCCKCGQAYATQLRRRRPQPDDTWFLDEVCLTINGTRHYLWRAVDQDDNVLDLLVQSRRNKKAAKKFF
jgi:putative transposase